MSPENLINVESFNLKRLKNDTKLVEIEMFVNFFMELVRNCRIDDFKGF